MNSDGLVPPAVTVRVAPSWDRGEPGCPPWALDGGSRRTDSNTLTEVPYISVQATTIVRHWAA
jgi:hypothetical protein